MTDIVFDPELIERYAGTGPRYTSYPTAMQFTDHYGAQDYAADVRVSNESGRALSLYLHIPFCRSLCYYCGCTKIVTRNAERVESYLDDLKREIALQGALFSRTRPVRQLHLGGGTPTYLSAAQLDDLLAHIADHFTLVQDNTQEFSVEVDPRTVDHAALDHLAAHDFNRLSLGVQDFEPAVQEAVNRLQSVDEVRSLTEHARACGFRSVSYDLIYGLPLQDVASFDRTLVEVAKLRPDRIAIYNYAHLPQRFRGQRMIHAEDLPARPVKLDILRHSLTLLTDAGYEYIGMDHFALPDDELTRAQKDGTLQRNFQGYSTHSDCDLIGLGMSAISHIGNSYAQNVTSTKEYADALARDELPIYRGLRLSDDDLRRADVIQELMCFDRVRFSSFENRYALPFERYFEQELSALQLLADDRLVEIDDDAIHVTTRGRLLLRTIAQVFDRYHGAASKTQRFSQTI